MDPRSRTARTTPVPWPSVSARPRAPHSGPGPGPSASFVTTGQQSRGDKMIDGTLVTVGKTGTKVYKAYKSDDSDWVYLYTLVPADGIGRKRYRVRQTEIRPAISAKAETVNTSVGRVRRPKSFRTQYPEYSGCTRRTYVGKEWVFKVARYPGDNYKNRVEAARYAAQTGMHEDRIVTTFGADAARALVR